MCAEQCIIVVSHLFLFFVHFTDANSTVYSRYVSDPCTSEVSTLGPYADTNGLADVSLRVAESESRCDEPFEDWIHQPHHLVKENSSQSANLSKFRVHGNLRSVDTYRHLFTTSAERTESFNSVGMPVRLDFHNLGIGKTAFSTELRANFSQRGVQIFLTL